MLLRQQISGNPLAKEYDLIKRESRAAKNEEIKIFQSNTLELSVIRLVRKRTIITNFSLSLLQIKIISNIHFEVLCRASTDDSDLSVIYII